jgi:acyl-CoA reductase-like NAD-dependent aldehyde dehydrogenase
MSVQTSPSSTDRAPGVPVVVDGELISSSPQTGVEVGRFPVADAEAIAAAVTRARTAALWWRGLGFDARRERLLRWKVAMTKRMSELLDLLHDEGGKPKADGLIECITAFDHITWAAKNAKRVLRSRKVGGNMMLLEFGAQLAYEPYGVIGVIGPWNYPIFTPVGSIAYALSAGNAVVFKPSEYTPAVARWYVDRFNEVVTEQPVLQVVYGRGDTGEALVRSGVDKVAFTGSPRTGKKIMAACADTLTPVIIEAGGKDAMIVDSDADIELAAQSAVWGAMTNAGQTCIGVERIYVSEPVYDNFVAKVVEKAGRLKVGGDTGDDIGPITMPSQIDVIRRHIDDAIARGGRAVLGGPEAVQPPFVHPTVLVDVPEDSAAVQEETFGPTITVKKVADAQEAVKLANDTAYGLGASVFGRSQAAAIAQRLRAGMVSINGTLSFAGMPSLPFGGVGESGFGRIHGDDGLREFARAKAITRRRMRSMLPATTFEREPKHIRLIERLTKMIHSR